ncbi:hypothetical protein [Streptomyces sp. NPDC088915]|uniref:hypothetical protein n=1 Tax=Streptomyces sp. NPDC088915 TaxID=3365912 RepID=UPI0037FE289F
MIRIVRTEHLQALQSGVAMASVLEDDLEKAEVVIEAYKKGAAGEAALRRKLVGEVRDLQVELTAAETLSADLARLVELLLGAVKIATDAADAPLSVVVHKGRVQSTHRDLASAKASTPFGNSGWLQGENPDPLGWRISTAVLPPLPVPASAGEIEDLLERVERPALEQLTEATRLQELTEELERVRSQRDTAIKDTETAAAALTAESLTLAFHRAAVTEAATAVALALSGKNPRASVREVSALLLRHATVLGIDPHGTDTGADPEKKGAAL